MENMATDTILAEKSNLTAVHAVHSDNDEPGMYGFFDCKYCKSHRPKTTHNKRFCNDDCKAAYHKMHKELVDTVIDLRASVESLEQRVKELESR